jgi:AcrR family transcriptional regulator
MSVPAHQKVVEAACRVISKRGLEGMTMQDVATEADVSKALLHYHFGSRRELILAAFEHSDDRAVGAVTAAVDRSASGKDQIRDLLLAWASDDAETQRHWVIWTEMWRWSMFEPELRNAVAERHARFIASISDLIRLGQADGSIAKQVKIEQAAQRLAACSDSFGDQAVIGIKSMGEVRVALIDAIDHECLPAESTL